ncbi:S-adenosylmethionine-dependent methyltransferase [Leptospira ognonensis]|uniref:S-adenosylmethionine-dependent methyltransferase n=1 Tax=Leptospira ognonensis TaxID=2484945 RepID=A0A4R9K0W6_9LEPT|nr:SAM-dependent methyltransferase [Leptospira ognonensis]TGL59309.1 S-adenosylmethionine-dependent methyltransferase [Leptospira ognonensis]
MNIEVSPIGFVKNLRKKPIDDQWSEVLSEIELTGGIPENALLGLEHFSHVEVIYFFDQVNPEDIVYSNHPRGNKAYPLVGIFAQRKKDRPNQLGLCVGEIIKVEKRKIYLKYLDAIDGTPVLDIKPVMNEFLPKSDVKHPDWSRDLMKNYW